MLGGISIWQLLIVLAIVVLLFGTKKLRTLGGDLGSSLKSFKDAMKDGKQSVDDNDNQAIEKKASDETIVASESVKDETTNKTS